MTNQPLAERLTNIDGIGPSTAKTIAAEFDDVQDLCDVVSDLPDGYSPARLSQLDGFGPKRARSVAQAIDDSDLFVPEVRTDGGQSTSGTDRLEAPMYCPACDEMVPETWDRYDETWMCPRCNSHTYEDKAEYIDVVHAEARFNKEHGYGPWWDGDSDE